MGAWDPQNEPNTGNTFPAALTKKKKKKKRITLYPWGLYPCEWSGPITVCACECVKPLKLWAIDLAVRTNKLVPNLVGM